MPRTSATTKAVVKVSTSKPGTKFDTSKMARAESTQLASIATME